jgi:hypothetical protein
MAMRQKSTMAERFLSVTATGRRGGSAFLACDVCDKYVAFPRTNKPIFLAIESL